jgi:hypothetical protein
MTIIGFDFSLNKPAACILHKNQYSFMSWPYGLNEKIKKVYKDSGVHIVERTDDKEKGDNVSEKMRYEVENSRYMANLIRDSLKPFLNSTIYLAFEGLSYGSEGSSVIQLGGYKYMLMDALSEFVPLDNMFTYSPITIKSVAGCAKKGMGKPEMINKFISEGPHCIFNHELKESPDKFKTPKSKNWIVHLDDLVDSYWVIQTIIKKEGLQLDSLTL